MVVTLFSSDNESFGEFQDDDTFRLFAVRTLSIIVVYACALKEFVVSLPNMSLEDC